MQLNELKNELLGEEMALETAETSSGFQAAFQEESEKPWEMFLLLVLIAVLYAAQLDFRFSALLALSYLVIFFGFGKNLVSNIPMRKFFGKIKILDGKTIASLLYILFSALMASKLNLESIFLLTIFLTFIFYSWKSQTSSVLGIAFLLSSSVIWLVGMPELAGKIVNYAYYFLAIAVTLEMAEYFRELRESEEVLVLRPKIDSMENDGQAMDAEEEKDEENYLSLFSGFAKISGRIFSDLRRKPSHGLVLATVFGSLLFYSNLTIAAGAAFFLAFLWFYWEMEIVRFLSVASFILYMLANAFDARYGQTFSYAAVYFLAMWLILELDRGFFRKQAD